MGFYKMLTELDNIRKFIQIFEMAKTLANIRQSLNIRIFETHCSNIIRVYSENFKAGQRTSCNDLTMI